MRQFAVIVWCVALNCGCDLVGPTCLARQQRGTVTVLTGEVQAGQIVSHVIRYETSGSQNDAEIRWDGYLQPNGPRLSAYATRAACTNFQPDVVSNDPPCAVLARAGTLSSGQIASALIITHGRGNPLVLGDPPEYRVWIVGDPTQTARYTITATWFFGPDC